ncbi:MAG: CHC2 zinc finger domain-containing protein [Oscillospiraceae bacterium]
MSIFEAVKQSVTTRQAAERYGIRVERNGMCRCPFHDDSTPSMKLDRRYYCFGCGATGDVIDFVSWLRGIGSKEAAILLAQDFTIPHEGSTDKPSKPRQQNIDEQNYQHMERYCFRVLLDYYRLLCCWKEGYAPQTPEDGYHPRFVEALQKLSLVEYLLDEMLGGDMQARASVVIEYGEEVRKLEQRMAELAAADEAAVQNADEQHEISDES